MNSRTGVCPSTHPYRIPKISYLVMHYDGVVPNPLQVSAGVNAWEGYSFMHADYFAANQPVFNNELLRPLLEERPGSRHLCQPQVRGRYIERLVGSSVAYPTLVR